MLCFDPSTEHWEFEIDFDALCLVLHVACYSVQYKVLWCFRHDGGQSVPLNTIFVIICLKSKMNLWDYGVFLRKNLHVRFCVSKVNILNFLIVRVSKVWPDLTLWITKYHTVIRERRNITQFVLSNLTFLISNFMLIEEAGKFLFIDFIKSYHTPCC
jgi:hypothetical protein